MARAAVLVVTLALCLCAPSLARAQTSPAVDAHYHGFTPGFIVFYGEASQHTAIQLVLTVDGNPRPHGWYFTAPAFKDHPLEGQWTNDGFTLDGKNGSRFSFHYVPEYPSLKPDQPLSLEVITHLKGEWSQPSRHQSLALTIQFARGPLVNGRWYDFGTSDAAIEKSAQAFLRAVEEGDARTASRYVDYPLATFISGKSARIRDRQEFLNRYNEFIRPGAAERAKQALPHEMFARDGLAMVLDGEVWFSEKGAVSEWLRPKSPAASPVRTPRS